jgi:SAM-dependent methyltransferase
LEQNARVALYFDRISTEYRSRYEARKPFHSYFFRQRLNAAVDGFAFNGKSVLDIGAGTGALYDELTGRFPDVDYFGCDISGRMLAQSSIPPDRAFVGRAQDVSLPLRQFNFIVLLGVTSYQEPAELAGTWRFISDRLARDGTAIISFTNRASIDHLLRSMMKLAKPLAWRGVFGQPFTTRAHRLHEVEGMAQSVGLRITRSAFLNQTFSPFNTMLPKPSVAMAKLIERFAPAAAMPFLSSDFLVFAERDPVCSC